MFGCDGERKRGRFRGRRRKRGWGKLGFMS
jgi:hypothetical protein